MRYVVFIFFSIGCLSGFAQETTVANEYKANAKSSTVEVNFNPFSSSPVSINYLRFRKFVTDRQAWRISGTLGFKSQKQIENVTQSSFEINLRPGYEWHFVGTERLSPYVGFDIDFALKTSNYSDDRTVAQGQSSISSISGAWDTNGTERGYTRFGSNLIIGADYYVIKRLYIGLEVGYGFQLVSSNDISITPRAGTAPQPIKGGSVFQIGSNYNSSLRLGFIF